MDSKKLEQFREKKREVRMLEGKLESMKERCEETISDVVQASSREFPYIRQSVRITGKDMTARKRMLVVKERLIKRKRELEEDIEEIERFIDIIEDSAIRQIIELRYIEGRKWRDISNELYGYPSEELARIKLKRFIEK